MLRQPRNRVERAGRRRPREDDTAHSAEDLSPEKRRIAEALAALLVAHYRAQHVGPEPEIERVPGS